MKKLISIITLATISVNVFAGYGGQDIPENSELNNIFVGVRIQGTELNCSGTMVRPNILVTAAHCVAGVNPSDIMVNNSNDNYNIKGKVLRGAKVEIPKLFNINKNLRQTGTDQAVVLLDGEFPTDIKVTFTEEGDFRGTYEDCAGCKKELDEMIEKRFPNFDLTTLEKAVLVAGRGRPSDVEGSSFKPGVFKSKIIPLALYNGGIFDDNSGRLEYAFKNTPKDGICGGDSGAPVFVREDEKTITLHGLVSYTQGLKTEKNCSTELVAVTRTWTFVQDVIWLWKKNGVIK